MSSDKPLPFQSKSFSLISRAKEEFNRVNPRENDNSTKVEDANLIKGANQAKKRSVLGRGLSQLMSSTTASAVPVQSFSSEGNTARNIDPSETNTPDHHKEEMKVIKENDLNFIPIDQLIPNEKQPRKHFSVQEIRELASKLQMGAHYEIVAGERRWRASKEAGLISVPAIIKDLNDRETLEIGIIENIQRQDLNPIEEALAYEALTKDHSCTQDELAKMVGKDRSTISNSLRLLSLPAEVKDLLVQRKLTAGHARALLQLSSPEEQIQRANDIAENKLSVRAVEQGNKEASEKKKSAVSGGSNTDTSPSDERNQALEERLRRALGTKVKVNLSASGKGEVKISFFSRSEFENFLEKVEA
jgi:ParB family chromosome partitioning protein